MYNVFISVGEGFGIQPVLPICDSYLSAFSNVYGHLFLERKVEILYMSCVYDAICYSCVAPAVKLMYYNTTLVYRKGSSIGCTLTFSPANIRNFCDVCVGGEGVVFFTFIVAAVFTSCTA